MPVHFHFPPPEEHESGLSVWLRVWPYTTAYLCVMVTVVAALLVLDSRSQHAHRKPPEPCQASGVAAQTWGDATTRTT